MVLLKDYPPTWAGEVRDAIHFDLAAWTLLCYRMLTGRSRGISMAHRLSLLRSYVRGWMGYFGLAAQ
ncbi:MAG: group II intron maturase-specific domain-containing protein, partial [Pirellulaceae bacterium]